MASAGGRDDEESSRKKRAPSIGVPLRELAYDKIKHRIITCEFRPGEVLNEAMLSSMIGIGRTPVRQAIDRLYTDGLITVMPRKGIMVKPISLDEIFQVIEVRLVNEIHCARRAAGEADANDIARLSANLDAMSYAAKAREIETMMNLDRDFHSLLSNIGRNKVMVDLLRNLHDRSTRFWFISLLANDQHVRVCEQHAAILDAIRRHDREAAAKAIRHHIEAFRDNVTQQL